MEVANNNNNMHVGYPPYLDEKRCGGKGSEIDSLADFFFGIDDLLEFPNDEIIAAPIHSCSDGLSFSMSTVKSDVNLTAPPNLLPLWDGSQPSELCVTCDDVAELEWLSHFVDESFSSADDDLLQYSKENGGNKSHSPSSTSLTENKGSNRCSSSDGGDSNNNENGKRGLAMIVPGRPRSKRARKGIAGAGWNSSSRMLLIPSHPLDDSSFSPSSSSSSSSSSHSNSAIAFLDCTDTPFIIHPHFQYINPFANSNQPQLASLEEDDKQAAIMKVATPKSTKAKMKSKPMLMMNCISNPVLPTEQSLPLRKCLHCGSQKTPQWRAGPLGPKTLCNACGVRHKSGRLFPEYRPAASPTFIESRHSNSHRKVLEMRRFKESMTAHTSIFT